MEAESPAITNTPHHPGTPSSPALLSAGWHSGLTLGAEPCQALGKGLVSAFPIFPVHHREGLFF